MDMTYSLKPVISELERAYQFFNQELFNTSLDSKIILTVQTNGKRNALGWHWANKWKNGEESRIAEINLSAETLKTNDPYETLIHEMVHHKNHQFGIRDTSNGGMYHNKRFKESAEEAGLEVKKVGAHGWAHTILGAKAEKAILRFKPEKSVFQILRVDERGRTVKKLKKWSCDCEVNVRVGVKDFRATCNDCGTDFKLRED